MQPLCSTISYSPNSPRFLNPQFVNVPFAFITNLHMQLWLCKMYLLLSLYFNSLPLPISIARSLAIFYFCYFFHVNALCLSVLSPFKMDSFKNTIQVYTCLFSSPFAMMSCIVNRSTWVDQSPYLFIVKKEHILPPRCVHLLSRGLVSNQTNDTDQYFCAHKNLDY